MAQRFLKYVTFDLLTICRGVDAGSTTLGGQGFLLEVVRVEYQFVGNF